jgi:DNA-directed RNA polymerase beta' subunit
MSKTVSLGEKKRRNVLISTEGKKVKTSLAPIVSSLQRDVVTPFTINNPTVATSMDSPIKRKATSVLSTSTFRGAPAPPRVHIQLHERDDIPLSSIESLQFSFISTEEILEWSVLEITSIKLSGNNSVYDLRMGPTSQNEECATCKSKWKVCPGHFGHIPLPEKVPHPLRIKNIEQYLSLFCFDCNRLVISQKKMMLFEMYKHMGENRLKAMLRERKDNITTCPHCDRTLPTIVVNEDFKFEKHFRDKKFPIDVKDMDELFANIPPCDVAELGLDETAVHPSNLLMGAVLVMPPCARTFIKGMNGMNQHDDLTSNYIEIVKQVNKYHDAQNSKARQDAYESYSTRIRTMMDNSKANVKNNHQNKRGLKCIKKRMTSKTGLIRGHIQGKRVDFCARSVITPEANGWVDELVMPECFAKNLTYPVRVNATNLEWCQQLLEQDKVVNIYRGDTCFTAARKTWTRGFELRANDIILRTVKSVDKKGQEHTSTSELFVHAYEQEHGQYPELMQGDSVVRHNTVYENIPIKKRIPFYLEVGDTIDRQLMDGDWTLFNRQPTLWKGSMRAMKIKIMKGKTFRFNMACTQAYNADHDKRAYRCIGEYYVSLS